MAAYSITFDPQQVKNGNDFEKVIKAISINFIKILESQYIISSNFSINEIVTMVSSCLTEGSPMFVNLIDARSYHSQHLDPVVSDQLTQVLF